jgi:hypothetical protein
VGRHLRRPLAAAAAGTEWQVTSTLECYSFPRSRYVGPELNWEEIEQTRAGRGPPAGPRRPASLNPFPIPFHFLTRTGRSGLCFGSAFPFSDKTAASDPITGMIPAGQPEPRRRRPWPSSGRSHSCRGRRGPGGPPDGSAAGPGQREHRLAPRPSGGRAATSQEAAPDRQRHWHTAAACSGAAAHRDRRRPRP